jgi:hypothetical protein
MSTTNDLTAAMADLKGAEIAFTVDVRCDDIGVEPEVDPTLHIHFVRLRLGRRERK